MHRDSTVTNFFESLCDLLDSKKHKRLAVMAEGQSARTITVLFFTGVCVCELPGLAECK